MSDTQDLYDYSVGLQVALIRRATDMSVAGIEIMDEIDKALTPILLAIEYPMSRAEYLRLRDDIALTISNGHKKIVEFFNTNLSEVALAAAAAEVGAFEALGRVLDPSPDARILGEVKRSFFLGSTLDGWLKEFERADTQRVIRQVSLDVVRHESAGKIRQNAIATLKSPFRNKSARNQSRIALESLARTFVNHAASIARSTLWKDNPKVVRRVVWVSTLDTKTTDICRFLDGKTYPIDDGPRPPIHIRCRSTVTPLVWKDKLPDNKTWYDWIRGQDKETAIEALGVKRYELWKIGDVAPEKFLNAAGERYTLADLKKRMPAAFKRLKDAKDKRVARL